MSGDHELRFQREKKTQNEEFFSPSEELCEIQSFPVCENLIKNVLGSDWTEGFILIHAFYYVMITIATARLQGHLRYTK